MLKLNAGMTKQIWRQFCVATMKASTSSSTVPVNAVPPAAAGQVRSSRIAPHSHIKGLGLTPEGYASGDAGGFIGQESAREVCFAFLGDERKFYRLFWLLGMRGSCGSHKIAQVLWEGVITRRCTRDR